MVDYVARGLPLPEAAPGAAPGRADHAPARRARGQRGPRRPRSSCPARCCASSPIFAASSGEGHRRVGPALGAVDRRAEGPRLPRGPRRGRRRRRRVPRARPVAGPRRARPGARRHPRARSRATRTRYACSSTSRASCATTRSATWDTGRAAHTRRASRPTPRSGTSSARSTASCPTRATVGRPVDRALALREEIAQIEREMLARL